MFWFPKNHIYPIGVDITDDSLQVAQLGNNAKGISLIAASSEIRPADVKPGSGNWQKWAIETIKKLTANGRFCGRDTIAAMPAREVFIDNMKMPKTKHSSTNAKKHLWSHDDKAQNAILSKIKQKLPFDLAHATIKYIPTEEENVMVMATQRQKIDKHLAIYEEANLQIKSIGTWPIALATTYARFFGRRQTDIKAIVMLACIESNCTNVVICRHKKPLFARSIPIGTSRLASEKIDEMINRLVLELTGCRQHFGSIYKKNQIERLVFLSSRKNSRISKDTYTTIAEQLAIPAQMGDCLAAVELEDFFSSGIDRRVSASATMTSPQEHREVNWATAFGLSLS